MLIDEKVLLLKIKDVEQLLNQMTKEGKTVSWVEAVVYNDRNITEMINRLIDECTFFF